MAQRRALVGNANDPAQVKRAGETVARRTTREQSELAEVLGTVAGARLMWRILESCGIHKLSFRADPYQTAFNEGSRNVGNRWLVEIFKADPDAYTRMQKDAATLEQMIPETPKTTPEPTDVIEEDDGN